MGSVTFRAEPKRSKSGSVQYELLHIISVDVLRTCHTHTIFDIGKEWEETVHVALLLCIRTDNSYIITMLVLLNG